MKQRNKFPNASVLSILTYDHEENGIRYDNDILYISVRTVPDYFGMDTLFWYPGTGRKGSAAIVWKKLKVKHWFACGKDDLIKQRYDHLLLTKSCEIDGQLVKFRLPSFTKEMYTPDPFYDRNQNETVQLLVADMSHFPQAFLQKENLQILSGYQKSTTDIKALYPVGLYEKNELYKNLTKKNFGSVEMRQAYLTFHGSRSKEAAEKVIDKRKPIGERSRTRASLAGMIGFYQEDFMAEKKYAAIFSDKNGVESGRSEIDRSNGIFRAAFDDQSGKGSVTILVDDMALKKIDYTLIKDIKFDVNMASGTLNDIYGRSHMQIEKSKPRPETFSTYTWQKDVYANPEDGNIKLSDTFKELFNYLGPNLVIADPYFINNIKLNELTKEFMLTDCQLSMLNAIATAAVMGEISELTILGYNSRANQHFDRDEDSTGTTTEQRFVRYETLFRNFIASNKLGDYLADSSIKFNNAPNDFHNRYWFSLSADRKKLEKCIVVTTSIGNMFEVDFLPITDQAQLTQITMKYFNLLKFSKNELSI
ncbi:hypothetical protein [Pedobacter insulae]|uniref:Uncharacterized protein n=1 Tax=Pedobacter insulae TaxID=414048 RepID=A0A1I2ZI55_9SPHI|nr:hypothetical protein [Pedobacter insulae]SFH37508.1 hypothetical protein SAMN04489864_11047 [Pedobacter insulae]